MALTQARIDSLTAKLENLERKIPEMVQARDDIYSVWWRQA